VQVQASLAGALLLSCGGPCRDSGSRRVQRGRVEPGLDYFCMRDLEWMRIKG
jgi:hypothetical protein